MAIDPQAAGWLSRIVAKLSRGGSARLRETERNVVRGIRSISIRQKLLLASLATAATALFLASAAFIVLGLSIARQASVHKAESLLALVGTWSEEAIRNRDGVATREILALFEEHPEVAAACLYTLDGEALLVYQRGDPGEALTPPVPEDYPHRFRDGHLELFRLLPPAGTAIGRMYLRYDPREYREWLRGYAGVVLGVVLVPFGLAWLLSARLRDFVSRPILELATVAERVRREKDYSLRARKESDDELGTLIEAFNAMLGRIQERDRHLQEAQEKLELRVAERTAELRQQLTRMDLLNQINRAIAQRQDLDSILHVVLGQLESRLGIDFGCVHLFDSESGQLRSAAVRSRPGRATSAVPDPDSLSMAVEESGLPTGGEDDLRHVANVGGEAGEHWRKLKEQGLGSAIALPLRVAHELFGVLTVARERVDGFSADEHDCLRALAEQVAVAGHHARLHAELRDAYDELRRTQQAVMQQDRLRALGQMASGIAHDINNALSPVSGFAELLLLTEPGLGGRGRKYLDHIKTAGDDVAQIVARLREFYRARPEDQPLSQVLINELIEQVIDLTRPRWRDISQQKGISIRVKADLDPVGPVMVGAEPELREALTNLVFNAIDAMPEGGTITVRSRQGVWLGGSDRELSPTHVVLEVIDTGTGMDEETREHCLEPFFSTKGQRGTGLGLPMVYGVVQRHQGCVEIESAPGQGTTFRLILPVRELPCGTGETPAERHEPLPSLRILFVDDEPLVRDLVRDMLEQGGHRVTLAEGGQAGLDAFFNAAWRSQPFDAVITDLGMPHLDGRQLAQILKRESPRTPVIMLTGWGSLIQGEQELRAPVDCLLSKPPRVAELEKALRQTMSVRTRGVGDVETSQGERDAAPV